MWCTLVTGSILVDSAHVVYRELVTAQQCLVLTTDLHLLYLCVPLELVNSIDLNWRVFFDKVLMSPVYVIAHYVFQQFTKLDDNELKVARVLDISEGYLSKMFSGVANKLVCFIHTVQLNYNFTHAWNSMQNTTRH